VSGLAPKRVRDSQITMTQQMLPSDANPYGNVHGGVIMKLIDSAAGACAGRHARQRVVTVRIDELSFVAPVIVGDLVYAKASVNDVGTTSMEVGVRVEAENVLSGKLVHVSSAYLVFVAIDEQGRPMPIAPIVPDTPDEIRRQRAAQRRRELRGQRPRREASAPT
jgi:uncharacterized protein (TIGR00369 family)